MIRLILTAVLGNTLLRVYGLLLYPFAYILREWLRDESGGIKYCLLHRWHWLWIVLDDSIYIEYGVEYQPATQRFGSEFLSSFYWSAWRNSCVNFWNWYAVGRLLEGETEPPYFRLGKHEKGYRIRFKQFIGNSRIDCGYSDGTGRFEMKTRKVI